MKYTGKGDDVKYVISPAELVHFFWAAASNMELVPDVGSKCWFRKYDGTSLVTQEWVDKHNEMLLGEYGMYIEDALDDIEKSVEKVSSNLEP